jgi:hypothetical protein
VECEIPPLSNKSRGVTYVPTEHKTLVYRDNGAEYHGSEYAYFGADQKMYVHGGLSDA